VTSRPQRLGPQDEPQEAAQAVGNALTDVLGEDLVAVYLHGSAVLGGFRWDRSDLDVLALNRAALTDRQLGEVVQALAPLPYPERGLEFSLLTAAQPEFPAPRFQLHLTTGGWDGVAKVIDGRGRAGDPDLVLHLAVCRAHGVAVVGPPPLATLANVPDQMIASAMHDEIGWARAHAQPEYLVLTSARVWPFAETHRIASKIEAGAWAAERYAEPSVIEAALARQRGGGGAVARDAAERLADYVVRPTRRG
jgi:streptomycin 3"-adenylyltransferase